MSESRSAADVRYRISSFSGGSGGNCVAVGRLADGSVAVRHSKGSQDVEPVIFNRAEWDAFVKGVKAGEFDPQ